MEHVPIASLHPHLASRESKQLTALVTLIWPYSPSARQFALLLAEPSFRARRHNGQVRVRFTSTAARALANTGVGIGDEVVLSLQGAEIVRAHMGHTPRKSVEWELVYKQTVVVTVRRAGVELARLEVLDSVATPAVGSPVRGGMSEKEKEKMKEREEEVWTSPAFLKRARLGEGAWPVFEIPGEGAEEPERKKRRKSYRDWTAWRFLARTPSPEKEDGGAEEMEHVQSPSRALQMPKTPVSPTRTESSAEDEDQQDVHEVTEADSAEGDTTIDEGELRKVGIPITTKPELHPTKDVARDMDTAPGQVAPTDSQFDFGGDTEINTDVEGDTVPDVEADAGSATELATELEDEEEYSDSGDEGVALQSHSGILEDVDSDAASLAEEEDEVEEAEEDNIPPATQHIDTSFEEEEEEEEEEETTIDETLPSLLSPSQPTSNPLTITMPPPRLPTLLPANREPSSPTLKPLDSATLPLPSPFPGEDTPSYLDFVPGNQQQEQGIDSDADYILDTSFFSSIGSAGADGDHETAFTPVRFSFGMDGAGWSIVKDVGEGDGGEEEKGEGEEEEEEEEENAALELQPQDETTTTPTPDVEKPAVETSTADSSDLVTVSELNDNEPDAVAKPEVLQTSVSSSESDKEEEEISPELAEEQITGEIASVFEEGDVEVGLPVSGQALEKKDVEMLDEDPAEDIGTEAAQEHPVTTASSSPTRSDQEPNSIAIPDTYEAQSSMVNEPEDKAATEQLPSFTEEQDQHAIPTDIDHPDVKMESVEDGSPHQISQPETQEAQSTTAEAPFTATPSSSQKPREPRSKPIPATGPARNTRSRAKKSPSPVEEDVYISKLSSSMRSTRSKASFDSTNEAPLSTPSRTRARTRSTVTPTREVTQTSPYSLRSQSKQLSPSESLAISKPTTVRRSPRKLVRRDTDFEIVASRAENRELFGSMFEASQELGLSQSSQGRFSDVGVVKVSEKDSVLSEDEVTVVSDSDHVDESATPRLKPPPTDITTMTSQREAAQQTDDKQSAIVSPSQPPRSSARSLRSSHSQQSASPSPRITRSMKGVVHSDALESAVLDEYSADESTPKAQKQSVMYLKLPSDGVRSSPPASKTSVEDEPTSAQQVSVQQSELETTQQTALDPPLSFQARQVEQSLATPEITQATTASTPLHSFDIALPGIQTQPRENSPPPTIPASNNTTSSPLPQENTPTIGLSTPLSYYTPLRDLRYFLNRSSTFHSPSSHPDILALCTTASTPPTRSAS
ncbi:hypothetical protein N0V94_009344, partial [Neodidymelliopsis sp. IMI 364377]